MPFAASQDLDGKTKFHNGPSFANDPLSRMALTPVIPVVRRGSRMPLEHHHMWKLKAQHATANAWKHFEPAWEEQKALSKYVNRRSSLFQPYRHHCCILGSWHVILKQKTDSWKKTPSLNCVLYWAYFIDLRPDILAALWKVYGSSLLIALCLQGLSCTPVTT